jgi:RimJ/RimL family protein N-acetyltransferase
MTARDRPISADPPARERVTTARLVCERIRPDHATELERLMCDPLVARTIFVDGLPPDQRTLAAMLARNIGHWEEHGFGIWMLRDREDGQMVGRGGLQHTIVNSRDEVEVGWAIVPERWGQGLATELAEASVAIAFDDLAQPEIVAFTLPHNLASRRVMDKSGFTFEAEIVHNGLDHVLYRRRRPG